MELSLDRIATQLMMVAQGYGVESLDLESINKEYQFRKEYNVRHLHGLAYKSMTKGFFKYELEHEFIKVHLHFIIEPKNFWKRNFTIWK